MVNEMLTDETKSDNINEALLKRKEYLE